MHGSPLFITRGGESRKLTRAQLRGQQGTESTHLVLTNVKYKLNAISSSEILRGYWRKFKQIAKSSRNIVIMGYGGGDTHLNDMLGLAHTDARIRIIERAAGKDRAERITFWSDKIQHEQIDIELVGDILEFRGWAC